MTGPIRILGIDPGSQITGFGVIEAYRDHSSYVGSGCIRTAGTPFNSRLQQIFVELKDLVRDHSPDEIAIERVFVHRNADSALKLGHARAAALCATFEQGTSVHEYAAREVKQAMVGTGAASKAQVQHMVKVLLGVSGELQADASDALAIALCHAHHRYSPAGWREAPVQAGIES